MASAFTLAAACGGFFAGPCSDIQGRKFGVYFGCVLIGLGDCLCGASDSLLMLLTGRILCGLGSGAFLMVAPVLLA